jgi:hypothetical protein
MCVVPHEAFVLMMEISRMDMSHGKTMKCACDGVIAWSGNHALSNAVSEITGRLVWPRR